MIAMSHNIKKLEIKKLEIKELKSKRFEIKAQNLLQEDCFV